jgi:predicted outer membrane repeat protein
VGGAIHITKSLFDHESADSGGAIDLLDDEDNHSTIENSTFQNCRSTGDGGAVYIRTDNVIVENVDFINNIAGKDGGALYWEGDHGTIRGSRFVNNNAVGSGDRINYTEINNTNTNVTEKRYNITGGDGGAIMWRGSNGLIEGTTFYRNTAEYSGGAIYLVGDADENCTNITFRNCNFTENVAKLNGGAINWASGASNATIDGSSFTRNTAWRSAGAIYISGNHLDLVDTEFRYNEATQQTTYDNRSSAGVFTSEGGNAGAICWMGSFGTVDNGTFISNTARVRGGAIQFERNQNGTVRNSRFENNNAGNDGGAIDWYQGAVNGMIIDSNFTGNNAQEDGGAVYIEGSDCKVSGSIFTSNTAKDEGGALHGVGNNTKISDCDFTHSTAADGGALFINGTGCQLHDSTFSDNTANDDGSG